MMTIVLNPSKDVLNKANAKQAAKKSLFTKIGNYVMEAAQLFGKQYTYNRQMTFLGGERK